MNNQYDIIILGSGMGGLASAVLLAKDGYKVCVLEKNNQFGGNLQTFVRDKTIFDTGVHYIGGLDTGQNLHRYFQYLGIMDELRLERMDRNGYDIVTFDDDDNQYPHAQGYDNFIEQLSHYFPEEKHNIIAYCQKIQTVCQAFPLYNLKIGEHQQIDLLSLNLKGYLDKLTQNEYLKSVLVGSNLLYAGEGATTPFYVHALSVNSYIKSAWRCLRGGSQIAKALVKQLRRHKGAVFKRTEVAGLVEKNGRVTGVKTTEGAVYHARRFISNIPLNALLKISGRRLFRKSFQNRVRRLKVTPSSFTVHIVFKPDCFPYFGHNIYHFNRPEMAWTAAKAENDREWPQVYMISMGIPGKNSDFAKDMSVLTYMNFEKVLPWEKTINTVVHERERGQEYEDFKAKYIEKVLAKLERKFPDIRNCIHSVYATTPLSYRDYIGGKEGSMYGFVKDANQPMATIMSPKTRLENFFLTGQTVNMHGILGTTIGAVNTCSEIIGREKLLGKIIAETSDKG